MSDTEKIPFKSVILCFLQDLTLDHHMVHIHHKMTYCEHVKIGDAYCLVMKKFDDRPITQDDTDFGLFFLE